MILDDLLCAWSCPYAGQHPFLPFLCEDQSLLGLFDPRVEVLEHPLAEPEEVVLIVSLL